MKPTEYQLELIHNRITYLNKSTQITERVFGEALEALLEDYENIDNQASALMEERDNLSTELNSSTYDNPLVTKLVEENEMRKGMEEFLTEETINLRMQIMSLGEAGDELLRYAKFENPSDPIIKKWEEGWDKIKDLVK